jgi:hypothetical protein
MKLELIQPGNSKLGKSIYMWNMTTSPVQCGRVCKSCYSAREEKRWPNVAVARQKRYEASLQPDFVSRMKKEISSLKTPPKYFRIHASSEFYDNTYILKWYQIALHFPAITFYAYTKRLKELNFSALLQLPNVVIIDSFHYKRLNYGPIDKAPANSFVCPQVKKSTIRCGVDCTWCMTKGKADVYGVYFVQH